MALSLNDEINHIQLMHKDKRVLYECSKCSKIYQSKHGAQCHLPKCRDQNVNERNEYNFVCNSCGKAFATHIGLTQHERHEHPLVRNAARIAEATNSKERKAPRGFGQVWSKEEVDLMLRLEISLQGEKCIAKEMTKYLPNKTNKQIRDKRTEKTYKKLLLELQETREVSVLEDEGRADSVTFPNAEIGATDATEDRGQIGAVEVVRTPEIVISDYSHDVPEEETAWRENFLQNTMDLNTTLRSPTKETMEIVGMLKTALKYAKEENGQVPIWHIDHIYEQVVSNIKEKKDGIEKQEIKQTNTEKGEK